MEKVKILKSYLGSLKVGRPISHENLTLFPVTDGNAAPLSYVLLESALAAKKLRIVEHGEGSVPELKLINEADQIVFLLDGEALVGARQNRSLNTSILSAANSSIIIPVSCVEQGRWTYTSREMSSSGIAYPDLRKLKHTSVYDSLRRQGSYHSDQAGIWRSVHSKLAAMGVTSDTGSMEEAYTARQELLKAYGENLSYPEGACGVIAAIDGRIVCADLFDSPGTLEKLWSRLVSSYALDAFEAKLRRQAVSEKGDVQDKGAHKVDDTAPGDREAAEFLRIPEDAEIEDFKSPGLGSNLRFRHARRSGHALVYQGVTVHAALFGPEEAGPGFKSPIHRSSRRRPFY
jgi:hypothetical protein